MLIQFSVGNFKTFKDKATLSLVASNYDKETLASDNIALSSRFNLRLLKSAAIYGANASGKSKFIEAMGYMKRQVLDSFAKTQAGDDITVHPFAFHEDYENAPSYFEIIFLINEAIYRYGFELSNKMVVSEWLYSRSLRKEVLIFNRNGNDYSFHPEFFKVGKVLEKQQLLRKNALLLSTAAVFDNPVVTLVISWFKKLRILSGLREETYEGYTAVNFAKNEQKQLVLNLLRTADFGIIDFERKQLDLSDLPDDLPRELRDKIALAIKENNGEVFSGIATKHQKFSSNQLPTGFATLSMEDDESSGTRKFFALSGPILDSLKNAHTLVVDELDSKLHPNLTNKIIRLFNSTSGNPKNAQLIFNTHNTNLLNAKLFRRDQIWFAEKDRFGAAALFSLADIRDVRKSQNFEEAYIEGRYGAIPYLEDFDLFTKQ